MARSRGREAGRLPDYTVSAMSKKNETLKGKVGGAWQNGDGTISIKLDPFVVLSGSQDLSIRLFPYDANHPRNKKPVATETEVYPDDDVDTPMVGDDIPF
jgi:hypothetical protein